MSGLSELAARCEAATGPDRELDREIAVAVFGLTVLACVRDDNWWSFRTKGSRIVHWMPGDRPGPHPVESTDMGASTGWTVFEVPPFTASLDAAMTLVPEGWYWMAGNRDRITPRAYVENGKPAFEGISSRRNPDRLWFEATAATPALALCAAALRARAVSPDGGGDA